MIQELKIGNVICSLVGTTDENGKFEPTGEYVKGVVVGVSNNGKYTIETIYSNCESGLIDKLKLGNRWVIGISAFNKSGGTYSYLADSIEELEEPIFKEVIKEVEVEKIVAKEIKTFYTRYSKNEIHNSNWIDRLYNWYRRNKFSPKETIEQKVISEEEYNYIKSLDV
jgi:hypothetical protein